MNSAELIKQMVENQLHLNSTAYSDTWIQKGTPNEQGEREWNYDVAASQEIAEFINSFWLPWWSKAEQDMANCRIELVDALHFMLSQALIECNGDVDTAVEWIVDAFTDFEDTYFMTHGNTLEFARGLQVSLNSGMPDIFFDLFCLCESIEFSLDKLFALYMGKSELNNFRQDNGYKAGTYKKKWDGVHEDNYFLSTWVGEQETAPSAADVRAFLEAEYAKFKS